MLDFNKLATLNDVTNQRLLIDDEKIDLLQKASGLLEIVISHDDFAFSSSTELGSNEYSIYRMLSRQLDKHAESHMAYLNNKDIQETIREFNVDPESLWVTLVYIYEYSEIQCTLKKSKENIPEHDALKIVDILGPVVCGTGEFKLTISTPGGQHTTTNSRFAWMLEKVLSECLRRRTFMDSINYFSTSYNIVSPDNNTTSILRVFAKITKNLLEHVCKKQNKSKWTFIGRLAYIFGLVTDERFLNGYELKRVITKGDQALAKRYGGTKIAGKDYYKSPVNIGALLSDTIKKNKTPTLTQILSNHEK